MDLQALFVVFLTCRWPEQHLPNSEWRAEKKAMPAHPLPLGMLIERSGMMADAHRFSFRRLEHSLVDSLILRCTCLFRVRAMQACGIYLALITPPLVVLLDWHLSEQNQKHQLFHLHYHLNRHSG